jgi:predicted PurR-regulated permease PerM
MKRMSPDRERPTLRRLVTLSIFVLIPLVLLGLSIFIVPKLIAQGQRFVGWVSQANPETEMARILEQFFGPYQFRQQFGGPHDPRYQEALTRFRHSGESHVANYLEFSKLETWIEGGFNRQFTETETVRRRAHLLAEGTSSQDFAAWLINDKLPKLQAQAKNDEQAQRTSDSLVAAVKNSTPNQLLVMVRQEPKLLAALQKEWIDESVASGVAAAKQSPAYAAQFREYYEQLRRQAPNSIPYTFEQFIQLQKTRPQGRQAFGKVVHEMGLADALDLETQLRLDFEAATKRALFESWWSTSSLAKAMRQQLETIMSGNNADRIEHWLTSLVNVPINLATALLLSFFICIDFPRLQQGGRRLRDTWLRGIYDEIVPALTNLGQLVGRAMRAQGLIALCNATLMFLAISYLGVQHAVLLSCCTFVLCLVPTLGLIMAWVLLVAVALLQPGGGLLLALQVTGAVAIVVSLETFVFSPRILGKMMELHPVLIIAVLPLAQYFFGVWGLILAMPVTVFVIHEVILDRAAPPEANDLTTQPDSPSEPA